MLKRTNPATFLAALEITSLGEVVKLDVHYHNRKASEVTDALKVDDDHPAKSDAEVLRFFVASWDSEYDLDKDEDLAELQDVRPGFIAAVISGFWQSKQAALRKN